MADELTNGFKKAFALHKMPALQAITLVSTYRVKNSSVGCIV